LLLIQVSDIHFRKGVSDADTDPERPYRSKLVRDAELKRDSLGDVNAILVVGDIAYGGQPEEFIMAEEWLIELAEKSGCPKGGIYVVPGNHDVDREITEHDTSVQNAQNVIHSARDREAEYRKQFTHTATCESLYKPIAEYNTFAAPFDCQLYGLKRMSWRHEIPINDDVKLALHGLTTTFLSGRNGQNDKKQQDLYLSPLQAVLDEKPGMVNGVAFHHPPDWLLDHDEVESKVSNRAVIHFFGHKHTSRIVREANYLRLASAAVNPDRRESGWEPGYNIVKIEALREGKDLMLSFETHIRKWQTDPDGFVGKLDNKTGKDFFRHEITISNFDFGKPALTISKEVKNEPPAQTEVALSESLDDLDKRSWVVRFFHLDSSDKREIAEELNLLEHGEMDLPEPVRYRQALVRAADRGLFEELKKEIEAREN
jgi:hypothetical protein